MTPVQKGAATTVALSALALVVAAINPFGGPFGPNGGGAAVVASGTGVTFTSTQTDGGAAFVAPTGQRVCLNGSACTQYVQSDGGSIGLVGAEVDVPNGFTDSQKVNPDLMITPYSVVSQAASGERAFGVAHDGARVCFGTDSGACMSSVSGVISSNAAMEVSTISVDTLGLKTSSRGRIEMFYPQPYPFNSLLACDSDHKGVIQTLSTDGRTYVCDGTTNQRVAYSLTSAATSLDFGSIASHGTETLTITLTGATTTDIPLCRPTSGGAPTTDIDIHEYMSAANTVSLVAHNDSGGNVDPPATTYTCIVTR